MSSGRTGGIRLQMAQYLLDSNAFLWAKTEPHRIRRKAFEEIDSASNQLFVSLATLWELAIKSSKGKLPVFEAMIASRPLDLLLSESGFGLLDIGLGHVMTAYRLPYHHRDPFDRMMIAQALNESMTLITSDETFSHYQGLSVLAA